MTLFRFKQFSVDDSRSAMKIGTDGVMLGAWCFKSTRPEKILDIGTGSGLIALMLAQRFSDSVIHAIDIDRDAILQAQLNTRQSPWHDRVTVKQADFMTVKQTDLYDAIVCNPPFYDEDILPTDPRRSAARHEGGLNITNLISHVSELLKPRGHFAMIAPAKRLDEIIYLCTLNHLDPLRVTSVKSREHAPDIRVMVEAVNGLSDTYSCDSLTIHKNGGTYSPHYKELTSEFYLESTFK